MTRPSQHGYDGTYDSSVWVRVMWGRSGEVTDGGTSSYLRIAVRYPRLNF